MLYLSMCLVHGQQPIQASFTADAWEVNADTYEFTNYKGKPSLYLENGKARLKNSAFKTGIIEYDVNFSNSRKFLGVRFRIQDPENYEEFYLRAHQSGNPDAMQYTPVFNGVSGWQLYHGQGHSTAYSYNFGEWIHIKLIVAADQMDVFINDMSQPVLHVRDLKRDPASGDIGFWTLLGGGYFANLSYHSQDTPQLVSEVEPLPDPVSGTITRWEVAEAIAEEEVADVNYLSNSTNFEDLSWKILPTEFTGLVNLAQLSPLTEKTNTILAKTVITTNSDQIKQLDIGYSDIARVYVNDRIVYKGQRKFRSRDYRYLGTIGYFDVIYLDLKKGENEIIFAITETQGGGWGLQAKLADTDGITTENIAN